MCHECNSGDIYQKQACADLDPSNKAFEKNCSEYGLRDGHVYERCRIVVQDGMYVENEDGISCYHAC